MISFFAAFAESEGTIGNNFVLMILAKLFLIFRFPTHVIFWNFISNSSPIMFYVGLLINSLIYGLLIERIITIIKRKKE